MQYSDILTQEIWVGRTNFEQREKRYEDMKFLLRFGVSISEH